MKIHWTQKMHRQAATDLQNRGAIIESRKEKLGSLSTRDAAFLRRPLDGVDTQALEHAITLTEIERDACAQLVLELAKYIAGTQMTEEEWKNGAKGLMKRVKAILPEDQAELFWNQDSGGEAERVV